MSRLYVSAAHRSSGKTTVAMGLVRALVDRGFAVQPFKKGPDYIDPMWLTLAARGSRPGAAARLRGAGVGVCLNLDPHLMDTETVLSEFARASADADLAIVEGNHGLFDGLSLDGRDSNAALARLLDAPVLLVVDVRGMTRGIAPLLLGYRAFDPALRLGGVLLNRVGGTRHEGKLRAVIEHYVGIPVLGAVADDPQMALAERHLGLAPCAETDEAEPRLRRIASRLSDQFDLAAVAELARAAPALDPGTALAAARGLPRHGAASPRPGAGLRVGVAMDRAFGFYYPDDLAAFASLGATLVPFDALHDARLPPVDALFIGGGFPETQAEQLARNASLRHDIRQAVVAGLPTYAECGGLMYLCRRLRWRGADHEMVGVIPADAVMHERPVGRGYVELQGRADHPWSTWKDIATVQAHEFHHSALDGLPADTRFAWRVVRGHGIDGTNDGLLLHNLLASYTHLRDVARTGWVGHFLAFAGAVRQQRLRAALAVTS